jgi:hypothetical protein
MSLLDDLIAYWKMDEASGNAPDAHSSDDLTLAGSVGSGTGKINGGRDFSGTGSANNLLYHANNSDFATGDVDFTFSCWVNFDSLSGNRHLITKDTTGSNAEYYLVYNNTNGRLEFTVYSSAGYGGGTTVTASNFGAPSTGTWYHVVAWHDSGNNQIGISVNGTSNTAGHSTGVWSPGGSTERFQVGGSPYSGMDGVIDEVGYWKNRVLTSGDISDLYNGGSGLSYDDFAGGGPETYTASAALTASGMTLAASATNTAPVYTAASTLTATSMTLSAAATGTTPTYTASSVLTAGSMTLVASATHTAPVYTATSALTIGSITLAATATHTAPVYTATSALTTSSMTLTASVITEELYAATVALTASGMVLAATGTTSDPVYTASSVLTATSMTLSATGTTSDPVYTATGSLTTSGITLAAVATHTLPVYSGSATLSTGSMTIQATVTYTDPVAGDYLAVATLSITPMVLGAIAQGPFVGVTLTVTGSDDTTLTATGRDDTALAVTGNIMGVERNLECYRNENVRVIDTISATDITGMNIIFELLARHGNDPLIHLEVGDGVTVDGAHQCTVNLTDLLDIEPNKYAYTISEPTNKIVFTEGTFKVKPPRVATEV